MQFDQEYNNEGGVKVFVSTDGNYGNVAGLVEIPPDELKQMISDTVQPILQKMFIVGFLWGMVFTFLAFGVGIMANYIYQ